MCTQLVMNLYVVYYIHLAPGVCLCAVTIHWQNNVKVTNAYNHKPVKISEYFLQYLV